jgi:hypothetical protein
MFSAGVMDPFSPQTSQVLLRRRSTMPYGDSDISVLLLVVRARSTVHAARTVNVEIRYEVVDNDLDVTLIATSISHLGIV